MHQDEQPDSESENSPNDKFTQSVLCLYELHAGTLCLLGYYNLSMYLAQHGIDISIYGDQCQSSFLALVHTSVFCNWQNWLVCCGFADR